MELSESSSDLKISLTESELEEDLPEDVAPKRTAACEGGDKHNQYRPESSIHSDGSNNTPQFNSEFSEPVVTLKRYNMTSILSDFQSGVSVDEKKTFFCFMAHTSLVLIQSVYFPLRFEAKLAKKAECCA